MVQPPLVTPGEAVRMACDTARFAVEHGADTLSLIRSYATPGAMQTLEQEGFWSPPDAWTVYDAARWVAEHTSAVTLVDAWSIANGTLRPCCASSLIGVFEQLNTTQRLPVVSCACRDAIPHKPIKGRDEYTTFLRDLSAS
jgi:uncharacterized Fe-S cluster-containing MiaB family protein